MRILHGRHILNPTHSRWVPGETVPGLGEIAEVKNLFGFRDYLLGRFHPDTTMQLLWFKDGRKAKALFDHRQSDSAGLFRTQAACTALACIAQGVRVPEVFYVDQSKLIVEFVEGTTLSKDLLRTDVVHALAQYNAKAHDVGRMPPRASHDLLQGLSAEVHQDSVLWRLLTEVEGELSNRYDLLPYGVCIADSALKNYILRPDGSLVFIDVLGLGEKAIGSMLVKQLLWLPVAHRKTYWDCYLESSQHASEIQNALWAHSVIHFAERAVYRSPERVGRGAIRETRYRKRKRLKSYGQSMARLEECLHHVPRDSAACSDWLLSLSGTT